MNAQVKPNTTIPVFKNRAEALKAATALVPKLRTRATRTESDRMVPRESIEDFINSGLTGIVTPKVFGGSELGMASLVEITTEIATGCGSSGWVFGVLTGHSWMLNLFPVETQREVFGDLRSLASTVYRLNGKITRAPGGYQLVGGEGRFCSGIDHAKWVIIGNAVINENGPPEPRFFVLPISDVEIVDDWFTSGMRGTGSRSIKIANAFIPEHRSVSVEELNSGATEGSKFHGTPLYRMPFMGLPPFSIIGAPLGMARNALHCFAEGIKGKLSSFTSEQLAEQSAMFARIAQAAVDVDSAYALILQDAEMIDDAADPADITPLQRTRLPRDFAFAAQKCRYAVTSLFEINGGSGIYDSSDLQRIWRDVNAASSHFAFTWDSAATNYGRAVLGQAPGKFGPKGR